MTFIVSTNVIASRPPERLPTGTPHARANYMLLNSLARTWPMDDILLFGNSDYAPPEGNFPLIWTLSI